MLKLRVFLFVFIFSMFTTFMPSRAMELNKDAFEKAYYEIVGNDDPKVKAEYQEVCEYLLSNGKSSLDLNLDRIEKQEKAKIQAAFEVAFTKMINEYNSDIQLRFWSVCKNLLRKGANPNFSCEWEEDDWTPLAYACKKDDVEVVRFLLQCPAIDIDFAGDSFSAPLKIACRNCNDEIVKLLLEAGANAKGGVSVELFLSVFCFFSRKYEEGHAVVKLLLQYGANPNMMAPCGKTALMYAKSFEDMKVLIEHGVNVNHRSNDGRSVLEYLLTDNTFQKDEDVNKCVSLLVKNGCEINSQDAKGYTALHRVTQNYNIKLTKMSYVVSALFNHGANPGIKDNQGRTAFDYAHSDDAKKILRDGYLNSPAVKDNALLLLGAKHVNSRGIDEFDGKK